MLRGFTIVALAAASLAGILLPTVPVAARGAARHAAMILDANTGAVLHNDDGDELRHPASLTKIMTLYLTFETIESGRLKMADRVRVSEEAASAAPSSLELKAGDDISVQDAIRALITKSANDVAIALAEKVGGSEKNFVRLMNARAKDLGMTKTNFENASGLPDRDQVTTARDMITLGLRLQDDYPKYYPMFALSSFNYDGQTYRNHNTLMNHFTGIDGIKTGYTSASGFNLVSSFRRGGRHLVGAVFGGSSAGARNAEMRNLLTRTFNRASSTKTRKAPPSPLIALLKLKSEPKLAERPLKPKPNPKPVIVAVAAPVLARNPVAAPVNIPPSQPQPPEPAVETAAAEPPVVAIADMPAEPVVSVKQLEMAKVKHVSMAGAKEARRPQPNPEETTDMPEETAAASEAASLMAMPASRISDADENIAPAASVTPSASQSFAANDPSAETVIPKLASAVPTALPSALETGERAMLGAADAVPTAATPVEPPPPVVPAAALPSAPVKTKTAAKPKDIAAQKPVQRGLPPSTLQTQALSLKTASAAQPATAGRYEIQIGAYASIDEAQKALSSVQSRAASLLQNAPSVTHPVQASGRQMFRARFSGFDSTAATQTCNELRRQAVDCFVMTAQ